MDKTFQSVVVAAVRQAKARTSLLWADKLAEQLADATPLDVDRVELGERLTREAIRQGIPVVVAPEGFRTEEAPKRRGRSKLAA